MLSIRSAIRRAVVSVALLLSVALVPCLAQTVPDAPSSLNLTILHDNDLHGHIVPFAYTEFGRSLEEQPSRGGAARRATLVRSLRAKIRNAVLLIDSGDLVTRGPFCTTYQGIADIEAMNAVGYDLAAIGNNEFKLMDGIDAKDAAGAQAALLQVIKRSRCPWICANAFDEKKDYLTGVQPYIVREIGGVRVGFLGLTTPRSASYPQTKGWTITDPIEAATSCIPEARKHCDILIAVTHLGVDEDKELAAKTTGIDAIVGGDSHTFLYKAVEVANSNGTKVPIVQDGEFGVDLGRFDLHFVRSALGVWNLASYEYELLPIGPNIAEARDVNDAIEPYVKPFEQVVGKLKSVAKAHDERMKQTTQVIVDAMRAETDSDLAFSPVGEGLFNVFRDRAVRKLDVYAALPFHDNVVIATLTGTQLKPLVGAPNMIFAGKTDSLVADKTYRVAIVDYIAKTTIGVPASTLQDTGRDVRQVVIDYLARLR